VFKKKQVDLYSVVTDSDGPSGNAHFEYQIKLLAERPVEKTTDTKVAVTFLELHAKYGDQVAPVRKLFGAASYQFPLTGLPEDYSLGGRDSLFVLPVLAWYLPTTSVVVGTDFDVPTMKFDDGIKVFGKGSLVAMDHKRATIKLILNFEMPNQGNDEKQKPEFSSTAVMDSKSGSVISAEGSMKGLGGTMTFRLKRI